MPIFYTLSEDMTAKILRKMFLSMKAEEVYMYTQMPVDGFYISMSMP